MSAAPAPVSRTRPTPLGWALAGIAVVGLARPPAAADRQVMVMVWLAVVTVVVVGTVWPMVSVRRIGVAARTVRQATVGQRVPVTVTLAGRFSGCDVRVLDPAERWQRATGPGDVAVDHLADRRGVFGRIVVEVRVTAPLGVVGAHRLHAVDLPLPIEVAPVPLAVDWVAGPAPLADGDTSPGSPVRSGDTVRSVRPYAPGDPAHLVHWPSTAHRGSLVVREVEPPVPVGQAIVLDLRGLGDDAERAASYAHGAARAVLAGGGELVLCTAEADGPVTARVAGPGDAAARLARATDGAPGPAPEGWPTVEIGT